MSLIGLIDGDEPRTISIDKPLPSLIEEHADELKLPLETKTEQIIKQITEQIVEGYKSFANELLELPSFKYKRDDMIEATTYMLGLSFDEPIRSIVALYFMRRAALERIPVSDREAVWGLLQSAHYYGGEKCPELLTAVQDCVKSLKKPKESEKSAKLKVENYLNQVLAGFSSLCNELDILSDAITYMKDIGMENVDKNRNIKTFKAHGEHVRPETQRVKSLIHIINTPSYWKGNSYST